SMPDGKLYFNSFAMSAFSMQGRYFNIARNAEDAEDGRIYLLESSRKDKNAYKLTRGRYMHTRPFFDANEVDYARQSVYYELSESRYKNKRMLVLTQVRTQPYPERKKRGQGKGA
ncbi:MAG: hypothetical protein ACE5DN_06330, partial [Flavobacteriales bacterium]